MFSNTNFLDETHIAILNSIGEAIFIHNPHNGIIHDVNEPMLKMYGYKRSEVIGTSVENLSAADEGFSPDKAFEKIQEALAGNPVLFEWKAKRKDQSKFWVEVSLKLSVINNKKWLIAVVRDISDKKENEIKIQQFYQFQKILADLSTKFISMPIESFDDGVNGALALLGQFFNADRTYVFIYSKNYSIMSNTHEWCAEGIIPYIKDLQNIPYDTFLWNHNQLINNKTIAVSDTNLLGEEAGNEKQEYLKEGIQSILVVPFLHHNQIIGFIGVDFVRRKRIFTSNDENSLKAFGNIIGQALIRKKFELKLKNAKIKAEESDKLKSAFLSNMSHEIRSPMNGILGFSELLATFDLDSEEKIQYIQLINESSKQLLSIINDIVDISKIEAGHVVIRNEKFDVVKEFKSIVSFYHPTAKQKNLDLSFMYQSGTGKKVINSDKVKLNQILTNLVNNAIKYTLKGNIEVKLSLEPNQLSCKVIDTGIGMDKKTQAIIFDRFRRADNEQTKISGGTGLGLAITKGYLTKMGGKIEVSSQKDKGSTFSFIVPLSHQ